MSCVCRTKVKSGNVDTHVCMIHMYMPRNAKNLGTNTRVQSSSADYGSYYANSAIKLRRYVLLLSEHVQPDSWEVQARDGFVREIESELAVSG